IRFFKDRCNLVLTRSDLVVARLYRNTKPVELALRFEHAGKHAIADRTEVVVLQLLPFRRPGPHERASRSNQIGSAIEELLIDQKILLLRADSREYLPDVGDAEQVEDSSGGPIERLDRAQERKLVVQGLARPRGEDSRNGQVRPLVVLDDEGRRGRIPGRISTRLEGCTQATARETRRIRLTLNQILAGKLCDGPSALVRRDEAVVLLGRRTRERLKPMGEVRHPPLGRPLLH